MAALQRRDEEISKQNQATQLPHFPAKFTNKTNNVGGNNQNNNHTLIMGGGGRGDNGNGGKNRTKRAKFDPQLFRPEGMILFFVSVSKVYVYTYILLFLFHPYTCLFMSLRMYIHISNNLNNPNKYRSRSNRRAFPESIPPP